MMSWDKREDTPVEVAEDGKGWRAVAPKKGNVQDSYGGTDPDNLDDHNHESTYHNDSGQIIGIREHHPDDGSMGR